MINITDKTTLDDLRKCDAQGNNGFVHLAEAGRFEEITPMIMRGEVLDAKDILKRNDQGINAMMVLGWNSQLDQLFSADIWHNNVAGIKKLWTQTPRCFQEQVRFDAVLQNIHYQNRQLGSPSAVKRRPSRPPKP